MVQPWRKSTWRLAISIYGSRVYRIVRVPHPRTGDAWCIYPTYDFAHGQTDAIEGITHSLCTLEFEDHRPLYDWLIESLPVPAQPRQYEFSRLNMTHTILSKRLLTQLVEEGQVSGWDDPRMRRCPSSTTWCRRRQSVILSGASQYRRAKARSAAMMEHCIRDPLNDCALRRMAVL